MVPSRYKEPMGRVQLEAMTYQRPVIVAGHAGLAETVKDGVNGLTFIPGCAKDLRKKTEWLLAHRELWSKLIKNGQRYVKEKHSPEQQSWAVFQIYQQLLNQKSHS